MTMADESSATGTTQWLNTPRSTWIALAVAVVLLASTWYPGLEERFREHKTRAFAEVGQTANLNFTVKDMNGNDVMLSSFAGKNIILNFWATWCGPCRKETPDLVALQAARPDDLVVIGMLMLDKNLDAVAPFVKEFGITYPILNSNDRDDIEDAFAPIDALPHSVIIGKNGKITAIFEGAASRGEFEKHLDR